MERPADEATGSTTNPSGRPTENEERDLFTACRTGDLGTIIRLSLDGVNVNVQNEEGDTPLYVACYHGHAPAVSLLLDMNADVDVRNLLKETALYVACKQNHLAVVETLLPTNRGHSSRDDESTYVEPDVNAVGNRTKDTPLLLACRHGDISMVTLLLSRNANVEARNKRGETPLTTAYLYGHLQLVKYLLNTMPPGTIPDLKTQRRTALAAKRNVIPLLEFLFENRQDKGDLDHFLYRACRKGKDRVADYFIRHGASVNARHHRNQTPLHVATKRKGNLHVVKLLVQNHADINAEDDDLNTALINSCFFARRNTVNFLLEKGAFFNIKTFRAAAKRSNFNRHAIVRKLIRLAFQGRNQTDVVDTSTLLHFACRVNDLDTVQILLDDGADVLNRNDSLETNLHAACKSGKIEVARLLLRLGADIYARDCNGNTPLHTACYNRSEDCVLFLLQYGADINAKGLGGCTPFHIAFQAGSPQIVQILLEHNADECIRDDYHNTPADCALRFVTLDD